MGVLVLVDPVVGTTTDATLIAANDAAIKAVINGGIDASNFGAGKILAPSKIQQAGAAFGQGLVWNGTDWAPSVTQRKTTTKTVNTTVAATDLLNAEIAFLAGSLFLTGGFRLTAWGDWLQNTGGAAAAPRLQLLLGGTTIFDTGAGPSVATSITRAGWKIVVEVLNGAANAQAAALLFEIGAAGGFTTAATAFTTGTGFYSSVSDGAVSVLAKALGAAAVAVNTALAAALVLNVINGSASASYETKLTGAFVEGI